MPFKIITWNINSVRLRIDLVARLLDEEQPDVLCLQETKCLEAQFPFAAFTERGYRHAAVSCQKGYHGVAVLSRVPFVSTDRYRFGGNDDARHVAAQLAEGPAAGTTIHNFYVPAGGDIPDPVANPKFAHKLAFLDEMQAWSADSGRSRSILVGDLNVAPLPDDVWSHKQMLNVVSHTPGETSRLNAVQDAGRWVDVIRNRMPEPERVYTWWSYRAQDWAASNRGRRLDHVWATPDLLGTIDTVTIRREARSWERPSDHVPVVTTLSL